MMITSRNGPIVFENKQKVEKPKKRRENRSSERWSFAEYGTEAPGSQKHSQSKKITPAPGVGGRWDDRRRRGNTQPTGDRISEIGFEFGGE